MREEPVQVTRSLSEEPWPNSWVHTTQAPEDCETLYAEWVKYDTPLKGQGKTFFCSCPSGDHGGFTQVDANTQEEAAAIFPELHLRSMRIYSGETMPLDA